MKLAEAAAAYARQGWAVLPLKARAKAPANANGCSGASSDADVVAAWWQGHEERNVGVACGVKSGGLIVLDIDVDEESGKNGYDAYFDWELEHGKLPNTVTARTGRGGMHLFYKAGCEVRNSTNAKLGIDVRGEGGYVMAAPSVHPNGNCYEWVRSPFEYEVAEADESVLAFIEFVRPRKGSASGAEGGAEHAERFELPDKIGNGERNDTLFRYASSLQSRGFKDHEIRIMVEAANRERCVPPLTRADIEVICESVCGRYEKGKKRYFRKLDRYGRPTGAVLHDQVAAELIEKHRACYVDGGPAIWERDHYATGWDAISRATLRLVPDSKKNDRSEVQDTIRHLMVCLEASRPTLIAVKNGVYDLEAGELVPMDESMVITNIVPHAYRADAYDGVVEKFLNDVSAGDGAVRANLEEVLGLCMYRSNEFGVCPVLVGVGANGKSTFIDALRNLLGPENVSSMDMGVLGRHFQTGHLLGKLANLGDDISNERVGGGEISVFKKVVTGETVYTDVKNGPGFEFSPYCTAVFSCNEFPRLGDSSEGMLRRLFPIPFDAHFTRASADFDPALRKKLTTESAAEYLLVLGLQGLTRVIEQRGMTENKRSLELVNEVREDNDSVLQWLADKEYGQAELFGRPTALAHDEYSLWCNEAHLKPFSRKKFTRKVNVALDMKSEAMDKTYATGVRRERCFVPK